jgi:hypothetical protein
MPAAQTGPRPAPPPPAAAATAAGWAGSCPPVGGTRSPDQAVAAVSQPWADFPKSNQGERRGTRARITGDARPGKTSPKRLNSRGRCAAPGRPRLRGSSAARTSRPRGRSGGHPGQEAASQLLPYRRARSVVGHDRTGTCRAAGNDRPPSRPPRVRTGGSARTRTSGGLRGPVRRMLLGGSRLGRWPILARALGEDGLNSVKDNPQEPRPGGRRADPPAPGRLGPWGSSVPRGTLTAFPSLARESSRP